MSKLRLIELFSGIGAQASALERLGVDFEHWITSEWEVNAVASYNAIHTKDYIDYSKTLATKNIVKLLYSRGVSTDGKKPMIVAMRGRNPDNPSDRRGGIPLEQRLEPNQEGICNCLTQLYKDNLVMETVKIKENNKKGYAECKIGGVADLSYPDSKTRRGRVQEGGDVSPALTVTDLGGISRIESKYRIRKLTPLECWRLMGFTDEEFKAAESVNSNTQLYKQAGNSIVVDVLIGIFRNIIDAMEVGDMEKTAEIKVTAIKTDEMIDLVKFREKEPELFDELVADYPAEKTNYFIAVGE